MRECGISNEETTGKISGDVITPGPWLSPLIITMSLSLSTEVKSQKEFFKEVAVQWQRNFHSYRSLGTGSALIDDLRHGK